jgi:hypothetical protein
MRKAYLVILMILVCVLALGQKATQEEVKIKELSSFAIVAQRGDVSLIADGEAARLRGDMKYIPLRVYLGLQGKGKIYAERSFFTLTDPKGNKHPMASVEEVTREYGPTVMSNDYQYFRKQAAISYNAHFNACRKAEKVAFFPNPAGPRILYDQVELPAYAYFSAIMYFANPGPLEGTYTLAWSDPKTNTSLEVPFTIKWEKEKAKK